MTVLKTSQLEIFGDSVTCRNQVKVLEKVIGKTGYKAEIRWDDHCRNGRNSFSITGIIGVKSINGRYSDKVDICGEVFEFEMGGCVHDELCIAFPELKPLIKYHLFNVFAPMYYIENTTYHANNGDLEAARSIACWDDATLTDLKDVNKLVDRLPRLMAEFKNRS